MKKPVAALILLQFLAPVASIQAALLINYDGTAGYSGSTLSNISLGNFTHTGTSDYDGTAPSDRRGAYYAPGTANISSSTSDYTGPDVYAMFESILYGVSGGNVMAGSAVVESSVSESTLRLAYNNVTTANATGASGSGALYFKTPSSGVTLDAASSMSLTTGSYGGSLTTRWLILDSGSYYVSSTTFAATASTTTTLNDPASITWLAYTPSTSLVNLNQSVTPALRNFTNIQGAGVYFEEDAIPVASGLYGAMDLLKFSFNGVPEPSVLLLSALGCLGLLRRRR